LVDFFFDSVGSIIVFNGKQAKGKNHLKENQSDGGCHYFLRLHRIVLKPNHDSAKPFDIVIIFIIFIVFAIALQHQFNVIEPVFIFFRQRKRIGIVFFFGNKNQKPDCFRVVQIMA